MKIDKENLSYILGLKLKKARNDKGLSLKELAEQTNLSVSYLSEIEKGKKYPKPEKIISIAEVLDIPFESLVSPKVDSELNPLQEVMDSAIFRDFPFKLFGISYRNILDLITKAPQKASAFLKTFVEISQIYDVRVEHFFFAALRSYQKMHMNYFPELEKSADNFMKENNWKIAAKIEMERYKETLETKYGYEIIEDPLDKYPQLYNFRSLYVNSKKPKLLVNKKLLPSQKAFILAREIGYRYLELPRKTETYDRMSVHSFDQVLNNFKASYFAGALLINKKLLKDDIKEFFNQKKWSGQKFLSIMKKYDATPEMFIYRFGHLIYHLFGIGEFHYLRFNNKASTNKFNLIKELNMSPVLAPHSIGLNEHYCRRWLSIGLLNQLAEKKKQISAKSALVDVQRAKFIETNAEFFAISLARPLVLSPNTNSSMIIGFLMNDKFKKKVKFWNDPAIKDAQINETCERCGLSKNECSERVAPPVIYEQRKFQKSRKEAIAQLIQELNKTK